MLFSKNVDEWIFMTLDSISHMDYIVEIFIISYERVLTFV